MNKEEPLATFSPEPGGCADGFSGDHQRCMNNIEEKDQATEDPFGQSSMMACSHHLPRLSFPLHPRDPGNELQVAEAHGFPSYCKEKG